MHFIASCHTQNCPYSVLIKFPSIFALCSQMVECRIKTGLCKFVSANDCNWLHGRGAGHKNPKSDYVILNSLLDLLLGLDETRLELKDY